MARFLDYLNSLINGFVTEVNKKIRNGFTKERSLICWEKRLISCGVSTRPSME
ncbi:hypothetical protein Patl1_35885 [Pistacia atlantica]|nr:hypothetical protein Patl1_35885 [Pistacia atlantica]